MEYVLDIAVEFWSVLGQMAPYLLFGFLVAGVLSVFVSPQFVERHLGRGRFWPVVKAAAFGVPLPLCSCGVIPVSASLRRHGAGRGATTAFLLSTPQTGVDSIMVTLSLIGWVFAVFRAVFAFLSGIVGGWIVGAITDEPPGSAAARAPTCQEVCCSEEGGGRWKRALVYGLYTLPADIGAVLLIGLGVAALISALLPETLFVEHLPPGMGQLLVLMAAGIPVYVCATASVPIAAALILKGVSPGAALAFLMTGPATNAATIATIWKTMGRRTATAYLLTVAGSAVAGGLLLDAIAAPAAIRHAAAHGWMLPPWVGHVAAVVLLVVLIAGVIGPHLRRGQAAAAGAANAIRLTVEGMTCSHCAASVQKALAEVPNVKAATVDLAAKQARVVPKGLGPDPAALVQAVEELGYKVPETPQEGPTHEHA